MRKENKVVLSALPLLVLGLVGGSFKLTGKACTGISNQVRNLSNKIMDWVE